MSPLERVEYIFNISLETQHQAASVLPDHIVTAGECLVHCLLNGGKIMSCGNGNGASIAQHFASAMLNRYERERPPLPAITLTADAQALTGIANESSYNEVFAKQVRALGQDKDVLIVVSASGNSSNTLQAVKAAHDRNIKVIALTGQEGGNLATLLTNSDVEIRVPADSPPRIQEVHLMVIHSLCDLIDRQIFGAA